jgi:hypothetical protein
VAQFLNDTFTEASNTALTSHTSDSGHSWSAQTDTMTVLGGVGYVGGGSAITTAFQISSATPGAAEYDVTIVCQHTANAGNEGSLGRRTASNTYYTTYCASGTVQLDKVVSGVSTNLGSWAGGLANGVDYTSKLEIRDAAKKVFIDGVERISSADNAITAAGAVGIRARSTGFLNSIVAEDTTGGGGHEVAIGTATETDTAQPIAARKAKAAGQATETDTAPPLAARRTIAIGFASETDAAPAIARAKRASVGFAGETDAAEALGRAKRKAIVQAAETDAAPPVGARKARAVVPADETDTAQTLGRRKTAQIGTAPEMDEALGVVTGDSVAIGPALETDSAPAIGARKRKTALPAGEADSALPLAAAKRASIGFAAEVDLASAMPRSKRKAIGPAFEIDLAQALARRKVLPLGLAIETDTALPLLATGPAEFLAGMPEIAAAARAAETLARRRPVETVAPRR